MFGFFKKVPPLTKDETRANAIKIVNGHDAVIVYGRKFGEATHDLSAFATQDDMRQAIVTIYQQLDEINRTRVIISLAKVL